MSALTRVASPPAASLFNTTEIEKKEDSLRFVIDNYFAIIHEDSLEKYFLNFFQETIAINLSSFNETSLQEKVDLLFDHYAKTAIPYIYRTKTFQEAQESLLKTMTIKEGEDTQDKIAQLCRERLYATRSIFIRHVLAKLFNVNHREIQPSKEVNAKRTLRIPPSLSFIFTKGQEVLDKQIS